MISAAVLLPITAHPPEAGEPHILFTKKSADVPHHKGQFSFPGGIVEERDGSRVETALREAWEEIRLPPDAVEVLGLLDDTATRATPFIITPVGEGTPHPVHFFTVTVEDVIWGATARILKQFLDVVEGREEES
ncbi:MAG: hypothetical protein DME16_03515 [Candidatus Rokuibacteriota bacterium]|nr:MAG: hypothetical protein DME16_03515 [Candidatus Rokubacteria bacterium]